MTALLRENVAKLSKKKIAKLEPILKSPLPNDISFEQHIENIVSKYYGLSTNELMEMFNIKTKAKSKRAMIISRMLDVNNITKSEEFIKSGMKFKTIKVESNGTIKESMSFPYFDFCELVKEEWESSTIRNMFLSTKFVFAVFKKDKNEVERFENIFFWKMPINDLDIEYKKVFNKTKRILMKGEIVSVIKIRKNKKYYLTNFPKSLENSVGHVRPHAQNKKDVIKLPKQDILTKLDCYPRHSFWLNKKYIVNIIKKTA